jgi:hypothetical protein
MAVFGSNVYVVWNENPHGKRGGDIMFRRSNNNNDNNDNGTTFENKIIDLSSGTEDDSFSQR